MPCFKRLDKRQISVKFTGLFSANTKKYYNFSRNPEIMFSGVKIGEKYHGIRWGNYSFNSSQLINFPEHISGCRSEICYTCMSTLHGNATLLRLTFPEGLPSSPLISALRHDTTQLGTSCAEQQISPWQQWVRAEPHTLDTKWSNQITQEVRRETVYKAWPGSGERINKGGCGIVTNDMISLSRAGFEL